MSVTVHPDGRVVVTKPKRMPLFIVERWVAGKRDWIESVREKFQKSQMRFEKKHGAPVTLPKLRRGSKEYNETVKRARMIVTDRVRYFAAAGGFTYGTLSIRNQKTRWGSCSTRGNLSFNYRSAHLPPELVDYLVVHELAHTKHHNHSARFWAEIEKLMPDYQARRNELHRYRF